MAKWGEGDPRWIVEERPDATNVNNWHWTEKNASSWSIDRIKELFKNIPIESDVADLQIKEVDRCEGDASANNRKGKLIFFYEWELTLKWCGQMKGEDSKKYTGTVKVPNLSEENEVTELDIQIALLDEGEDGQKLKEIMLKSGKEVVRNQLSKYISSLKEEFSKGMILPKKGEVKPDAIKTLSSGFNKKINMTPIINDTKQLGLKIDTTTIEIDEKFQCRAEDLYKALTNVDMVRAFTNANAKVDPVRGGKFELFDGNIHGKFEELQPDKKVVMEWRVKHWPDGHYSLVTISIEDKGDHTKMKLVQTGVPTAQADATRENWQRYYWNLIKRTFGFGAFL